VAIQILTNSEVFEVSVALESCGNTDLTDSEVFEVSVASESCDYTDLTNPMAMNSS
jgi:hypothetical protein